VADQHRVGANVVSSPDRDIVRLLKSSNSNEWYTPRRYIEAAREVLGRIDLDPASCDLAQEVVRAEGYFTKDDDGLKQEWRGCVWCNPPYGRAVGDFVRKGVWAYERGEVEAIIFLLNASAVGTKWFRPLWRYTLCFTDHRINFDTPDGRATGSTNSSVFVYLGDEEGQTRFAERFSEFGFVTRLMNQEELA
jgi:ParB family chromosome partitioning protein